ncbi:zinc ABC transporter substrate-binding protein [Palleronia abyssalis]|uniref:High-affinity zinc uptake system protein ZnuA n=1 Tax=Palleronia abyssalis TaxID=1501240 RepID=A0A2R8C0S4_9RHOB|nr:zinc ABC transporter substrate-binding protein [Palleronia abyssalis]SPJ26003.1 High-affinity zinc uptake system protein ZnuA [Palleronia abyssalis]
MSTPLRSSIAGGVLAAVSATVTTADVPAVAADIAPVHSLVARVMEGVGTPELIVQPGTSPHGYSMRPSEARAVEQADAVFWIGPELTSWLGRTLETLAGDAVVTGLLDAEGTRTLEFREGATFEAHDHGDEDHDAEAHDDHDDGEDAQDHEHAEGHEDGHDHEHDEAEHDHEEEHDHDHEDADHAHDGEGHAHEGVDPHAWLDPENGKAWLDVIAAELSELDPENAETYRSNAAAGQQEIDAASEDVRETLDRIGPLTFVVFHDAYHYFEARFDYEAVGAIALSDASDPSPARVEEVQDTVEALGVECVFAEPQFNQNMVRVVLDGTEGRSGVIDPLGMDIDTGPDFYPDLLHSIADQIAACKG